MLFRSLVQKASTIATGLTDKAKAMLLATPELRSFERIYDIAKCPAANQLEIIRKAAEGTLSRDQLRTIVADARKQNGHDTIDRGGRPAKSRAFRKIITTEAGVQVIVQFRKTKATTEEVIAALKDALRSLAA